NLIFLGLISLVLYRFIIQIIELINPVIGERLLSLIENNDVSGRDNAYEISLNQFYSSPLFGDYFVMTSGPLQGLYPHNILIESLMTLGIIGSLPLFYMFFKTFYTGKKMLTYNSPEVW